MKKLFKYLVLILLSVIVMTTYVYAKTDEKITNTIDEEKIKKEAIETEEQNEDIVWTDFSKATYSIVPYDELHSSVKENHNQMYLRISNVNLENEQLSIYTSTNKNDNISLESDNWDSLR